MFFFQRWYQRQKYKYRSKRISSDRNIWFIWVRHQIHPEYWVVDNRLDTDGKKCLVSTHKYEEAYAKVILNFDSKSVLRNLEILTGFIIGEHNRRNMRHADDTKLIADKKRNFRITWHGRKGMREKRTNRQL